MAIIFTHNYPGEINIQDGIMLLQPVAAGVNIVAGQLLCYNASKYLLPASDTAGLSRVIGIAVGNANNTNGSDGDVSVNIVVDCMMYVDCSGLSQANVDEIVYVSDEYTVVATSTNKIVAGLLQSVDVANNKALVKQIIES